MHQTWTRRVAATTIAALALATAACSSSDTTTTGGTTAGSEPMGTEPMGTDMADDTMGTDMADDMDDTMGTDMADDMAMDHTVAVIDTDFGPAIAVGEQVVYTWDTETSTTPVCTHDRIGADGMPCDEKWPVVEVDELASLTFDGVDAASFTVVERPDGRSQLALGGRLLYTMSLDGPGDANCQGAEGWYIVNPDGTSNRTETPIGA
ncbi:MAG: hypothetical protein KDB33_11985 [Acidimicrobiales bacterium]|nr:hypothetical protein [Acidimicrobiales bacterium]